MKSFHYRRNIGQLAVLGVLAALFIVYLKVGLLPGRLKEVATRNLEVVFKQKVEFDRVVYLPFRGVSIDGLKTATPEGEALFTAKRLRLQAPLLLFLFDKRIIISKAVLDKPYFAVYAENPDDPHGSDTLKRFLADGINSFLPDNVYLESLQIRNGRMRVRKSKRDKRTIENVSRLSLDVNFKNVPIVPVTGAFALGDGATRLTFDGNWDLRGATHELHAHGSTQRLSPWAVTRLEALGVKLGKFASDFEIDIVPNMPYRYTFDAKTARTRGQISWAGKTLAGEVALNVRGSYDAEKKRGELLGGALAVKEADIVGLGKPVGELRGLKGTLFFDANQVNFKNVETGWYGVRTFLSGHMMLGAPKAFHLEIRQRADNLRFLKKLAPNGKFPGPIDLSDIHGNFSIEAELDGEAERLEDLRKNIVIAVSDTDWTPKEKPANAVRQINGIITMLDKKIQLNNASFVRGADTYHVNGWLDLEPGSSSELNVSNKKFQGRARLRYLKNRIAIDGLELSSGTSWLKLSGEAQTAGGQVVHLTGKAGADTGELAKTFAAKQPWLATLAPTGEATFDITAEGRLSDKKITGASIKAASPLLKLYGKIPFQNLTADLSYRDGRIQIPYAKTTVYHGELRINGWMDLKNHKRPLFQCALTALGIDLSKAAPDFPSLDSQFSGMMDFETSLNGYLSDRSSYLGSGRLSVKHGKLFTTPLFKRLRNLLFVTIEGIDNLTFREAQANFSISDGSINTSDATLKSELIDVFMSGKIGLDKTLKLIVQSRFTPDLIRQSYEIGGLAPMVINYAETQITEYSVTGSLAKPVYTERK